LKLFAENRLFHSIWSLDIYNTLTNISPQILHWIPNHTFRRVSRTTVCIQNCCFKILRIDREQCSYGLGRYLIAWAGLTSLINSILWSIQLVHWLINESEMIYHFIHQCILCNDPLLYWK
jgi:hypothetical protein